MNDPGPDSIGEDAKRMVAEARAKGAEEIADPAAQAEFFAIATMLSEAEKHGMLVEVVWSFGNAVSGCVSIPQACAEALHEWDL